MFQVVLEIDMFNAVFELDPFNAMLEFATFNPFFKFDTFHDIPKFNPSNAVLEFAIFDAPPNPSFPTTASGRLTREKVYPIATASRNTKTNVKIITTLYHVGNETLCCGIPCTTFFVSKGSAPGLFGSKLSAPGKQVCGRARAGSGSLEYGFPKSRYESWGWSSTVAGRLKGGYLLNCGGLFLLMKSSSKSLLSKLPICRTIDDAPPLLQVRCCGSESGVELERYT
ncbi:hypothetical protein CC86DRAFT_56430 [Ophiobolus disseminans]|uniref:Uncharacterized protein n=1 Tax=Ophiobolus disseminans TaxID=1469910 RepID=A0A6A6ZTV3_9PLEO|nr:hypothetical protein CC86DRAFT_56430 [Ophiobolus disseminans]